LEPLRIVFAGTPEFATPALRALIDSEHEVVAVFTQPDRPAGRNRKLRPSPVKEVALEADLPVHQPESLREPPVQSDLEALNPDLMVVVAYGQLLPRAILDLPRHGCLNIHASLLPRWRGAAPIARALLAGDSATGVTIMRMEPGLDTGPIVLRRETPIDETDTAGSLHDRLAELGAGALRETLDDLPGLLAAARPQPAEGVTHAPKISKDEGRLDWHESAKALARKVRAFDPWPVAWTPVQGQPVRIWSAHPEAGGGTPGLILEITNSGLRVATGEGVLCITRLQLPGKKVMDLPALRNGRPDLFLPGGRLDHE
jgi:methionyl-tRNA formyltransferase